MAHVALVLGFPSARASVPPSAGTEAGLVWLDSDAGEGEGCVCGVGGLSG